MVRRCEIVESEIRMIGWERKCCFLFEEYVGKIMGMVLWEKNKSKARNKIFSKGIKEETFSTKSELEFINCTYSKSIFFGKNKDFFQESGKILYMFLFIFTCSV